MQKKASWDSGKKSVAEISDQQVRPQGTVTIILIILTHCDNDICIKYIAKICLIEYICKTMFVPFSSCIVIFQVGVTGTVASDCPMIHFFVVNHLLLKFLAVFLCHKHIQ